MSGELFVSTRNWDMVDWSFLCREDRRAVLYLLRRREFLWGFVSGLSREAYAQKRNDYQMKEVVSIDRVLDLVLSTQDKNQEAERLRAAFSLVIDREKLSGYHSDGCTVNTGGDCDCVWGKIHAALAEKEPKS